MSRTAEVVKLETQRTKDGQTLFTISRLSREFKKDRKTVTKRLEGTPASGVDARGYEGWTLDVAAPLLLQIAAPDAHLPDAKYSPFNEDKHYAAQLKKLELERQLGQVVPIADVRRTWAEVLKTVVAWVQALPDQLERAAGLTPQQVQMIEQRVDELRGDLHAEIVGDDAGE